MREAGESRGDANLPSRVVIIVYEGNASFVGSTSAHVSLKVT